jgi:hypothetical protein
MKKLELEKCKVQELNNAEISKVNGGSEFSEAIFRLLGYVAHACAANGMNSINLAHGR